MDIFLLYILIDLKRDLKMKMIMKLFNIIYTIIIAQRMFFFLECINVCYAFLILCIII